LETLESLEQRGILLGIATGKSRRGLEATLDVHGIRERFATLQTADDAPSKPHPGMVLQAMQATGSEPAETVMLGDTVFDMQAAMQARATGIGVAWGCHPREDLRRAGADLVIEDYAEFLGWLDEN
jgi:phosphoglycolate phosphatase